MSLFKPGEQGTLVVLPYLLAVATGVQQVFIIHPRYRLTYVDGTTEEAVLPDSVGRGLTENFFQLVGAVQEAARICGRCVHFIRRGDSGGMCGLCDHACGEDFACESFEAA
jgi:hypothetical protein